MDVVPVSDHDENVILPSVLEGIAHFKSLTYPGKSLRTLMNEYYKM